MLGRGWEHSSLAPLSQRPQRPAILNAQERQRAAQQAAQLAQVAALRAAGALSKPNPNSTVALPSNKRKSASDPTETAASAAAANKQNYVMHSDGSVTLARPVTSLRAADADEGGAAPPDAQEMAARAKRAKLAEAFGLGGGAAGSAGSGGGLGVLDSAATERMLSASTGSKHAHLVQASASSVAAQEALFDLMERKEAMALQLNSITQQSIKGYRCTSAGCTAPPSEYPIAACKLKGHKLERVELQKRFFTCAGCKFHLTTLAHKLPTHACHKCGGTIWSKAAMIPIKIDSSDRDQLQLRSEETWLRGAT